MAASKVAFGAVALLRGLRLFVRKRNKVTPNTDDATADDASYAAAADATYAADDATYAAYTHYDLFDKYKELEEVDMTLTELAPTISLSEKYAYYGAYTRVLPLLFRSRGSDMRDVVDELTQELKHIVTLIDESLGTRVAGSPLRLKVKADFLRYLAEVTKGGERIKSSEESLNLYQECEKFSGSTIFSLAVSFNKAMVFLMIHDAPERAKIILEDALKGGVGGQVHGNTKELIDMLRKTIDMWTGDRKVGRCSFSV